LAKKYYWTRGEEAKLLELYKKGITDPNVLAKELERKPRAVEMKLQRMGVVVVEKKLHTTTTVSLIKDLLTHEQALKVLAGALELLRQPGQDKLELQRLRILVDAMQTCDSVLEMRAPVGKAGYCNVTVPKDLLSEFVLHNAFTLTRAELTEMNWKSPKNCFRCIPSLDLN